MIGITFIAILLVLFALKELIVGLVIRRKRRQLTHQFRIECTQRHFAEARNQLMQLVIDRKLSPESETFRDLYHLNTGIMRRSDYYPEIGLLFAYTIWKGNNGEVDDRLLTECKHWTPEIKAVVIATADAMNYLIINHSRFMRAMFKIEKAFNHKATPSTFVQRLASKLGKGPVKKDPVVSEIRRTQVAMYRLADA